MFLSIMLKSEHNHMLDVVYETSLKEYKVGTLRSIELNVPNWFELIGKTFSHGFYRRLSLPASSIKVPRL